MQSEECRVRRTKPHHAAALGHKDVASVVSGGGRALKGRGVESTWLLQIHAEVTKGGKAGVKGVRPFLFIPQVSLFPAVLSYLRSTQVCPRLKPHAISADSGSGLVAAATYYLRSAPVQVSSLSSPRLRESQQEILNVE